MFGLMRKSMASLDMLASGMLGWVGWGSASGAIINERSALDVAAFMCGARVIAEGCAQVPVRVMRTTENRSEVATDHWAHKLLSQRPNSWMTSFEFREGMLLNAVIGKGAIAIKSMVRGEVRELLPVPAGSWSVEQLPDWSIRFRVDYSDKTHGYFDRNQIFYLRGPSLDGIEGLPAVKQVREALGLSKALEQQQAKLAGNGGKPSGVLSFKNLLKPETKEQLRDTWQKKFGFNGEGGIAILDGDASFQTMTMTSVDAQHLETRRFQIEEIARGLRIQPIMLMQGDKTMTFASSEQMFRTHVIHGLLPWYRRFEEAAERDILGHAEGYSVDLDERGLTRGDFKDQAEYYTKALGSGGQPGWMTQNEIRREVGLDPSTDPFADEIPRGAMNTDTPAKDTAKDKGDSDV